MTTEKLGEPKFFALTIHDVLKEAAATLAEAGVEDSPLEAELLVRHCLNLSRTSLFLRQQERVLPDRLQHIEECLRRRCQREPLQHITGTCEFWSMDFYVSPAVLIPRPETEFLLEHVLSTLSQEQFHPCHVLDLCTGSGVIATVLAKELPSAAVTASDCSLDALAVARRNLLRHNMAEQVRLLCADLLTAFSAAPFFDLIVSNPPYIKAGDLPGLQAEVRDWEPHLALSGGSSGMEAIETICAKAAACLRPGGWLFMEIGADLGAETEQALQRAGCYEQVRIAPDWAGRPRVAQGKKRQ
ncbi:Release factor glutamine methyltransferase [Candidatus Electronema halotolerans]